jgi:hypothetical protein
MQILLFGSFMWAIIILISTVILLLFFEHYETGWANTIILGVVLFLLYKWSNIPLSEIFTLTNCLIYFVIGFLYSLLKTYITGKKLGEYDKKHFKLSEHVFRWWGYWPFSLVNLILGDLLVRVWNFSYKRLENIYVKLFNM